METEFYLSNMGRYFLAVGQLFQGWLDSDVVVGCASFI